MNSDADVEYAKWKYTTKDKFDYEVAEAQTPELLIQMNAILKDLVPLLKGKPHEQSGVYSLNEWGFAMDDIKLLPELRTLSCVAGLNWPAEVKAYMVDHFAKTQAGTYLDKAQK